MAVLLNHSPANLRNHLQLNANLFESDWTTFQATVRMDLQARRSVKGDAGTGTGMTPPGQSAHDHSMHIGYVGKAKGKEKKDVKGLLGEGTSTRKEQQPAKARAR